MKEIARELAQEFFGTQCANSPCKESALRKCIVCSLASLLERVREEALEEAELEVTRLLVPTDESHSQASCAKCQAIVIGIAAIRALKVKGE